MEVEKKFYKVLAHFIGIWIEDSTLLFPFGRLILFIACKNILTMEKS